MQFSEIIKILLMARFICAQLELEEIKKVECTQFGANKTEYINPGGALSPIRGHILHKSGHMHNKRFFSPEIDISYSVKKANNPNYGNVIDYIYTRKPGQDNAREEDGGSGETEGYLYSYYQQIIHMFPSAMGDLSISSGISNSFSRFIAEHRKTPDVLYVLSALLLLSEGVDVSIKVERVNTTKSEESSMRLVLRKQDADGFYANLDMRLKDINPVYKERKITQTKTEKTVNFFKSAAHQAALVIPATLAEPATYKQFMSGEFMNTPQFLIQSYIYEFIDSADMYIKFVGAVYTLLTDYINNIDGRACNKKEHAQKVLNSLFMQRGGDLAPSEYTAYLCKLEELKHSNGILFFENTELPDYTRVPIYSGGKPISTDDYSKYYSNCVEATLLGLFCCFAFDPETRKYTTEHMPGASEVLVEFFSTHSTPKENINYSMHLDWCKVVAGLGSSKIDYLRNSRNELCSGLINMLYLIREVAGHTKALEEAINYLEAVCSEQELSGKHQRDTQRHIQEVCKCLSKNQDVQVVCEMVESGKRSNGRPDIFVKNGIQIIYTFKEVQSGVALMVSKGHSKIYVVENLNSASDDVQDMLTQLKERYKHTGSYMRCIIKHYINIEMEKIKSKDESYGYMPIDMINYAIDDKKQNYNFLMLWGKIDTIFYKSAIIESFLIETSGQAFSCDSSIVRFTENILGSVLLDTEIERDSVLLAAACNLNYMQYYKKIEYNILEAAALDLTCSEATLLIQNIFLSNFSKNGTLQSFKSILQVYRGNSHMFQILASDSIFQSVFGSLIDTMPNALSEVVSIIKLSMQPVDRYTSNDIFTAWLIHASRMNSLSLQIVEFIYNTVDHRSMSSACLQLINLGVLEKEKVLSLLDNTKGLLCQDRTEACLEKYNKIHLFFQECKPRILVKSASTLF
ncbi:uncharacterized protein NEPG_02588 [Nematocida parisii ERTm1]|uniref:uncharacterized protein n=1 Tax=Nematocida parisii (strain ERTm1 / ATCC PRA-289) TaxID=881290 RepID=UPI000264B52B|nr:uncharacterized protein NEPG_02588 [Nematocida parisii ERTm1]EIJ92574.1 hypothetical protein NEPG_02588 [Nematocida parisii ERTm1]|eukprot:XP_013060415.1 hypothetical protein NEPG_02588 [Nematocida parisii ERTm1]